MDIIALPLDIRNICVFLAPVFSGFTAISCYELTVQCTNKKEAA
jgi:dolichyl-diphosphooligosaccharide--protein glycosyltransferase